MRRLRTILLAGFAGIASAQEPEPLKDVARWRGIVESALANSKAPGVSAAVIFDREVAWAAGFGVRDAGGEDAVDATTLFQAASISKPVAALGAMILVERGDLDLDADVNLQLKSWQVPASEHLRDRPLALRHLLSHNGGVTGHGFGGYRLGAKVPTLHQLLDGERPSNSAAIRVDTPPGQRWRYSGGGYCIAQQLMIDLTDEPFPSLLEELVLRPLAMEHSTYLQPLPDELRANAARAHRRTGRRWRTPFHVYPEMAAAGLWTTPTDLARFWLAIDKARRGEDGAILGPKLAREMLTAQFGSRSGLGPILGGAGDDATFGHGGSNWGFRCRSEFFPERGIGAVVMTNLDDGSAARAVIDALIADLKR